MAPMSAFRCANGDYLLVPVSAAAQQGGDDRPLSRLGTVTCRHLDETVRATIGLQLEEQGFARISRAQFFAPNDSI